MSDLIKTAALSIARAKPIIHSSSTPVPLRFDANSDNFPFIGSEMLNSGKRVKSALADSRGLGALRFAHSAAIDALYAALKNRFAPPPNENSPFKEHPLTSARNLIFFLELITLILLRFSNLKF